MGKQGDFKREKRKGRIFMGKLGRTSMGIKVVDQVNKWSGLNPALTILKKYVHFKS